LKFLKVSGRVPPETAGTWNLERKRNPPTIAT